MAVGDVDVSLVQDPTISTVSGALALAVAATNASGSLQITPLGMGKAVMISMIATA